MLHAEAVAAMTFLGLHAEPAVNSDRPSFHSEIKRIVAAAVYSTDKT
jgi:hypothetical protein